MDDGVRPDVHINYVNMHLNPPRVLSDTSGPLFQNTRENYKPEFTYRNGGHQKLVLMARWLSRYNGQKTSCNTVGSVCARVRVYSVFNAPT
jgi:hypothetical protein